jgi:hypothetical protein
MGLGNWIAHSNWVTNIGNFGNLEISIGKLGWVIRLSTQIG